MLALATRADLNAVWIKIFPDVFIGPTILAPLSVVALRSEAPQWVQVAFYCECFSIFMRMYSSFGLVFIGINCVLMSTAGPGQGCPAAFTTVFSVPFFLLSWYDLGVWRLLERPAEFSSRQPRAHLAARAAAIAGFHVAAVYINRDLFKLLQLQAQHGSGGGALA